MRCISDYLIAFELILEYSEAFLVFLDTKIPSIFVNLLLFFVSISIFSNFVIKLRVRKTHSHANVTKSIHRRIFLLSRSNLWHGWNWDILQVFFLKFRTTRRYFSPLKVHNPLWLINKFIFICTILIKLSTLKFDMTTSALRHHKKVNWHNLRWICVDFNT